MTSFSPFYSINTEEVLGGPFPSIDQLQTRTALGIRNGLENTEQLLNILGRPDRAYPVILIGGTNGKGSTGALLSRVLSANQHKVGWTTSPHLTNVCERIWIDGSFISMSELNKTLTEIFEAEKIAGIQATYFELLTTAALLAFRNHHVDVGVIEIGMGGRLDSANATEPILSIVTNVGLDHQQHLGATREAIAREKLCIARTDRPLVLGPTLERSWASSFLECTPRIISSPPLIAEAIEWDRSVVQGVRLPLAGQFQVENLATVYAAASVLSDLGFSLESSKTQRGIETTTWPGRLSPLPNHPYVWLDGAHNDEGMTRVIYHLQQCEVNPHIYFGVMKDKDIEGMAKSLHRLSPRSLTTIHGHSSRFCSPDKLAPFFHGAPFPVGQCALDELDEDWKKKKESPILVLGSLYLLGDILQSLHLAPLPLRAGF